MTEAEKEALEKLRKELEELRAQATTTSNRIAIQIREAQLAYLTNEVKHV